MDTTHWHFAPNPQIMQDSSFNTNIVNNNKNCSTAAAAASTPPSIASTVTAVHNDKPKPELHTTTSLSPPNLCKDQ